MSEGDRLIGTSLPTRCIGSFDANAVLRYATASGDDNPIHCDREFAKSAGLHDCIVHGMLIAAQFEDALANWRPDCELFANSTRFVRPAFIGEKLTLRGRVVAESEKRTGAWIVRLEVRGENERMICIADAHVTIGAGLSVASVSARADGCRI